MRLRPHHLLCTQTYSGRGYSAAFTVNMTAITNRLRNEDRVVFDLVFTTDDICAKCPKMLGANLCEDNEKVKRLDQKTADYFGLERKSYVYKDVIREINSKMTKAIMDDICSDCSWYSLACAK